MQLTRRQFLGATALASGAALIDLDYAAHAQSVPQSPATSANTAPALAVLALNRMAYGPRPGDIERVEALGLEGYVEEQLAPNDADDAELLLRLATATLRIKYDTIDELRPLLTLNQPLAQLWPLVDLHYAEKIRPVEEVKVATWLRAVYSKWQLREVLTEFWHNHFNVNAYSDHRISATWPLYDRDVIRRHCLGNFRAFLESVATSVAMMFYLDNVSSKDGPANENYARELFELHTLGSDHYFNDLYDDSEAVPRDSNGVPVGYIDGDVYEAARAFTGWTIAAGQWNGSGQFANTGAFLYFDAWHDNARKYVLATTIKANQPPLTDGRKVLDLIAFHPATAQHICTKLCQRLVADVPSAALVQRAVATWTAAHHAPDQIAQTVRTILLSPEFAATWGAKVKRPFELYTSFLRATAADFTPNVNLFYQIDRTGYHLFAWPTPTGHPDTATPWLSTNVMLLRWNILFYMTMPWMQTARFALQAQMPPSVATSRQIVDFWIGRLLGRSVDAATYAGLLGFMAQDASPDQPPSGKADDITARIDNLVRLIAMTPDFQWR